MDFDKLKLKQKLYDKLKEYSPGILRISMALVFLWFSINQLISPGDWIGFLPEFLGNYSNPEIFIYMNAVFEIILGTLLILGFFIRISALLLGLHLIGISITLGYSAIAIRDIGLAIATLCVSMNGKDRLCVRK